MKAGATQVVSPFSAGANRMVQLLTRPAVVDLIELVTGRENLAMSSLRFVSRRTKAAEPQPKPECCGMTS
jgi:Trk K+ transport system NAD-binding subunit